MKSFAALFLLCIGLTGFTSKTAGQESAAVVHPKNYSNSTICLQDTTSWTVNTDEYWPQTEAIQPGTLQAILQSNSAQNAPAGNQTTQAAVPKLSLHDAEQLALKNHPRITISELNALASKESARQVKSAFYPTINLNATGVDTYRDGNRITAGALNNQVFSIGLDRA